MQFIGNIEPFVPGGNFPLYKDRVEQFFQANDVNNEKKVATFVTIMGCEVYEILCSLCVPDLPSKLGYEEIMKRLMDHFEPKRNKRAERYKFHRATQENGESVKDYIIKLKSLAKSCEFGDVFGAATDAANKKKILDEALVDRFIVGIQNVKIQQKLLGDDSNDFEKCCQIALNMEMAAKEIYAMKPETSNVLKVSKGQYNKRKPNNYQITAKTKGDCRRCGREHTDYSKCPAINWKCFVCQKIGHTSVVCRNKHNSTKRTNQFDKRPIEDTKTISCINKIDTPAVYEVEVNGIPLQMEVDTGASVSIISAFEYRKLYKKYKLTNCSQNLLTVTGETLNVVGMMEVQVRAGGNNLKLELIVVHTNKRTRALLGRNWLDKIKPEWRNQFHECTNKQVNAIMTNENNELIGELSQNYPNAFDKKTDNAILGHEAEIIVRDDAIPIFHAPYSVPFCSREKVKSEIDRLVRNKILVPVTRSKWASPAVFVPKSSGELRMCLNCKVTINRYMEKEHYPIPKILDIFAHLSKARVFCIIDLEGAYQQVTVSEKSRELLTVNTIFGLYQYTRMPFGVSTAPLIFQQIMDEILKGLQDVFCYQDDIIIGGIDKKDCKEKLQEVMKRLNSHFVRINVNKSKFLVKSVKYLGHKLTDGKILPNDEKVEALVRAKVPKDLQQLQSYLGLLNHYSRFIPNLSSEISSLYELTKKDTKYVWSENCQKAFERSKKLMVENDMLELYDPTKQIIVATDASPYGVSAILSHLVDGIEKPVLFASSSLKQAQKNYSQIHREALAIIYAVTKFHDYIYGRKFKLCTDQQALSEIFKPNKGNAGVAAARLQRWSILLSMYDYQIEHRPAKKMCHVDALSRLPLEQEVDDIDAYSIKMFHSHEEQIINQKLVAKETFKDKLLSQIYKFVHKKWPNKVNKEYEEYNKRKNYLSTEEECLYYGNNLVIPTQLRKNVLGVLHENHNGIVKMKMIARSYVWWPNIHKDIEIFAKNCLICQKTSNHKKEIVETEWSQATYPFERIHIDFFHLKGKNFLIIVDAFSKLVEIQILQTYTAIKVIEKLKKFMAIYGICKVLVSDNGPPFDSNIFLSFCKAHGIECLKSPPYHPQSNGLAERNVQTAKKALIRFCMANESQNIQVMVDKYLIRAKHTPSTTTGRKPIDLIFSYKQKGMLDIINEKSVKENISMTLNSKIMHGKKANSKMRKETVKKDQIYKVNDKILYQNHFKDWVKWMPATVLECLSNLRYLINVNGQIRYVHANQIKKSSIEDSSLYHSHLYTSTNSKEFRRNKRALEDADIDNVPKRIRYGKRIRKKPKRLGIND